MDSTILHANNIFLPNQQFKSFTKTAIHLHMHFIGTLFYSSIHQWLYSSTLGFGQKRDFAYWKTWIDLLMYEVSKICMQLAKKVESSYWQFSNINGITCCQHLRSSCTKRWIVMDIFSCMWLTNGEESHWSMSINLTIFFWNCEGSAL